MENRENRKVNGELHVNPRLQIYCNNEVTSEKIDAYFREIKDHKIEIGGIGASLIKEGANGSRIVIAAIEATWADDDYYMMTYSDNSGLNPGFYICSNPDQNAEGKVELFGEEWSVQLCRKDIAFVEKFFKQFIETGTVNVKEFVRRDGGMKPSDG